MDNAFQLNTVIFPLKSYKDFTNIQSSWIYLKKKWNVIANYALLKSIMFRFLKLWSLIFYKKASGTHSYLKLGQPLCPQGISTINTS